MTKKVYNLLAIILVTASNYATAKTSDETMAVYGHGSPQAPAYVVLDQPLRVDRTSTVIVSGYHDPDDDPFLEWNYEWRTDENGGGDLLSTEPNFTPNSDIGHVVYLRVRATSERGYPMGQRLGDWIERQYPTSMITACLNNETLNINGLVWLCPMSYEMSMLHGYNPNENHEEDGINWARYDFNRASSYCAIRGSRLPTKDELLALHAEHEANNIISKWPLDIRYWSSDRYDGDEHIVVSLKVGNVSHDVDKDDYYTTCVK